MSQGEELLDQATQVLGSPAFVCAPSGIAGDALEKLHEASAKSGAAVVGQNKAFDRLEQEPELHGLVCRFDIVPEAFLSKHRFLNLHNSLLPKWRGVHPLQWALLSGDKDAGITYHICEPRVDSGSIALQRSFPILETDDINDLFEKVRDATRACSGQAIENWLSGQLTPQAAVRWPYATQLDHRMQELSKDMTFHEINRIVRMSQPPWPQARFIDQQRQTFVVGSVARGEQSSSRTNYGVEAGGYIFYFDDAESATSFTNYFRDE
jgi:methionyl-tRNA formyltransferase